MFSKQLLATVLVVLGVCGASSCTVDSEPSVSTVEQEVLPPPTTVTATATSSGRITVSWTSVPNAVKYYVYQSLGPTGTLSLKGSVVAPGTSLLVANLNPDTEYCYAVRTGESNGSVGPFSSPLACATTFGTAAPPPPNMVTATATGTDRIRVDWSTVSAATRYSVYQSQGTAGPFALVGSVLSPGTSFQSANLASGTLYCFRVASVNGNGEGAQSASACATTLAEGLVGFWSLDEGSGTTAIDRSGYARDGTLTGAAVHTTDRPLMDNNRFALQSPGGTTDAVQVPDASVWWLNGAFTVAAWVKVPATSIGTARIAGKRVAGCGAINWELSHDAGGLHFRGQNTLSFGQGLAADTWTHVAVTHSNGTATAYVGGVAVNAGAFAIGPRSGDPMQFGNAGGCASAAVFVDHVLIYTRALSDSEVAVLGTPPPAPTNFTATVAGARRIDLSWDAVADASKYLLYKNDVLLASVLAPSTTYSDGANEPSSTSRWVVRSVRDSLVSEPSPEQVVTTDPPIAAPTGVTALAVDPTRIRVDWIAVTGAVKYYVYQSANGGAYVLRGSVLASNPSSYTAANLTTGVLYCYQVQTQGPDSRSEMSAPACDTP